MTIETYDEVLLVARRLPLVERLRLASTLVSEATHELPTSPSKQIPMANAEIHAAHGSAERLLGSISTENELSDDDLDRIRFAHLMEKHA